MSKPNCDRLEEILRRTGLGSLRRHFEDEGIDEGVLDSLTEADLERMGVKMTGDRKRIMEAIWETKDWVKPPTSTNVLGGCFDVVVICVFVFLAVAVVSNLLYKLVVGSSFVRPEMVEVVEGVLPADSEVAEKRVGRFWIGQYDVTRWEWKEVRKWALKKGYEIEAGAGKGEKYPVTMVSWYSAVKWCNAKSEKEGLVPVYEVGGEVYRKGKKTPEVKAGANGYRLPRDGEWEWAARGGVNGRGYNYSGSNNVGEVGWCDDLSNDRQNRAVPHKVGMKKANELGIYDMSGNVWQWCFDQGGATGRSRVTRGGSVSDDADYARVSYRGSNAPSDSFANVGVRVVWSPVP